MEIIISDLPCYEEGLGDEGIRCEAFKQYVVNEIGQYTLKATDHAGMLREHRAIVDALHQRFIENGFCLLQRAVTEESRGEVGVAINTFAGKYGECPPLEEHRRVKSN